ncbi:MAG: hypothetical protein PHP95_11840 [Desulfuromonadaceae bacterium]|nr:hypothetical protein [Desulfuromonadaceae bacterium]MDD2849137.1 hypothetical protein [Desulfuromonadaceae bacterium]MDD4129505.1 hypothetical protein [Desulfuromonadaceae bacterium]
MRNLLRKIPIKRILKITALTVVGLLVLLLIGLYFLPAMVSSQAVQSRIQQSLSASMKRQLSWSKFAMSWSDGLTLSGLHLGDGPAPLLKADIEQIIIDPSLGRGDDGRLGIDLTLKISNVSAALAPGPPKPPPPPSAKDPLTLLAEAIQKLQGLDVPLPLDLRVNAEVAPLNVVYSVPVPGKSVRLHDFSFRLAMPSLASKPVTAVIKGRVSSDGHEVGKITLDARVSDLVTKERRIHLAGALFAVEAVAPGAQLTLTGGLSQPDGVVADCKLDLPALLAVAQPFVPPGVPDVTGTVDFRLRAKVDATRDIHATVTVDGAGLAAGGGSLKARRVGPLDLKLQQQIATDHVRQRVDFSGGTLVIPGLLDAAWNAVVNRPSVPERSLEVTFGPLRLELAKALALAAPFLPPDSPVKEISGTLALRSLALHLEGPANSGNVTLTALGVKLPQLRLALKKGDVTAENIDLLLEKVECPLTAKLPTKVTADLLWSIKKVALSADRPLVILGAGGKVALTVTDLDLKSASPRKVAASAVIIQSADLDRASLGTQLIIDKAHEQLRLLVRAAANGDIAVNLPEFSVTAASLQGNQGGKRIAPIPFSASMTVAGVRIPADKGSKPALQRATARVLAGDFLHLDAEAALSAASPQQATTSGTARLDLRHAMPFAAPFMPPGLKADGVVTARWDLAAPLPEKAPSADKHPLRSAKAGLALIDKLELGVKLDNISATLPSAKGTITVTGVQTKPDLRVVSTKRGKSVRFEGGVQFATVGGLPGAAGKLPPQHGSFAFNGELSSWREFRLSEKLLIEPLTVSQEAELNVSRIDALLEEKEPFSTATLIKRLDATLFVDMEGAFSRQLKQLLPGIDVAGNATAAIRVDLSAARELAVRCSLQTKDFGVQLANGTKVEGMRSNVAVNRVYALAAAQGERWTPLSASLVRPVPVIRANPGAVEIVGRIHDDLRGDVSGGRSFSIKKVTVKRSGVPLELTALEGDLLLTTEKSGLSFFQTDLLGGTLLARGLFDLRPEIPVIDTASSFSNLDVTLLLPKETRGQRAGQDAEITGEMSLTAPLTPEQRELFEQLRLALNVRKIGADTLERALFSLDPYERNEQVVAQRKMLRLGRLLGLRANAVDGAFSMEGEALIKGIAVELPKVERLRISELPMRQELARNRGAILALRTLLDLVRADTLVVGPKGELSLKRRNYAH